MAFALTSMVENGRLSIRPKWLSAQLTLYGAGQAMFVSGLFIGGYAGLQRKTFGAAQRLDTMIKLTGMTVMGIGGLLAVAGGVLFVVFMLKAFLGREKDKLDE
jgi:heme/copper-type cytochrome/quinol oxidase subunit 1